MQLEEILVLKETENKVEFKEAKGGSFSFNGGDKANPKDRRRCILGYVIAFANEGGGYLVFGIKDKYPHEVVGTNQSLNEIGRLEQEIYNYTRIRVSIEELYDETRKRVLVIQIPSRPIGKCYKFEDVALMRVGEELLPMSDEHYLKIIQEQEPDFSAKICQGTTIDDLDEIAIKRFKEIYSKKQDNELFLTQRNDQCLSDLGLVNGNKVTYAALILLGKEEKIKEKLPQAAIHLEYRNSNTQITFDDRQILCEPYFLAIDKLWDKINLRNGKVPVQEGPYIFDIPFFNKEVIREGVNNAIAHRDYSKASEVVIKQFSQGLHIINPGGFPLGVSLKNLLTVNSTPRNRLLTEILAKTGIVERSGQGIDKIFYQSLTEGKGWPDYSASDDFQVELRLSSIVKDKAFALFVNKIQNDRKDRDKLSVLEVITLESIKEGIAKDLLDKATIDKLFAENLIEKVGKTSKQKLRLSRDYYAFINKEADYTKDTPIDDAYIMMKINQHLVAFEKAKMGKFVELFEGVLNREQVKTIIYKLSNPKAPYLEYDGSGSGRTYKLGKMALDGSKIINRAIEIGLEVMKTKGEI